MCLYSFTSTGDAKLREAAEILRGDTLADHTLETPGLAIDTMLTLLCFSKAVWRSRWTFRDNQVAPQATAVLTTIANWFQRYWRSTDLQQHGRRDKVSEAKCFTELLQSLPAGHLAFTDGSAFKIRNAQGEEFPGPAGAGAIFYIEGENCPRYRSKSIGVGTNSLAEVQAVPLMTSELVEIPWRHTAIYIFIDNRTAIAVVGLGPHGVSFS
jgi:hypothetical protein